MYGVGNLRTSIENAMKVICRNCGLVAHSQRRLKGNVLITLILLLCAIVPGIIYMIWRRSGLKNSCFKCASENVFPVDSDAAVELMESKTPRGTQMRCPECKEWIINGARKCKHCGSAIKT